MADEDVRDGLEILGLGDAVRDGVSSRDRVAGPGLKIRLIRRGYSKESFSARRAGRLRWETGTIERMLKSFAAHNFRCFREFQVTLGRRQLLMGVDGTGKSAFFEALGLMRELVVREERAEDVFQPEAFYRWKQNPQVSFELHYDLKGCEYVHKLTLRKDAGTVVVEQESLEGPGFDFRVHSGKATVTTAEGRRELSLDPKRAALGGHAMMEALPAVTRVASQYNKILCLRIRPEAMSARIFSEELRPRADFGNFASWYLHISRVEGGQVKQSLMQRLRAVLDGFQDLELRPVFRDEQRLIAVFRRNGGQTPRVPV